MHHYGQMIFQSILVLFCFGVVIHMNYELETIISARN